MLREEIKWLCVDQSQTSLVFENQSKNAIIERLSLNWVNNGTIEIKANITPTPNPKLSNPSSNQLSFKGINGEALNHFLTELLTIDPTLKSVQNHVLAFINSCPTLSLSPGTQPSDVESDEFKKLLDSFKEKFSESHSLQPLIDLASTRNIIPSIDLKQIASQIHDAKKGIVYMLHNPTFISLMKDILLSTRLYQSSLNDDMNETGFTLIPGVINYEEMNEKLKAIAESSEVQLLIQTVKQLLPHWISSQEAHNILEAINVESVVSEIESDRTAMQSLAEICAASIENMKYTYNEPSIVNQQINEQIKLSLNAKFNNLGSFVLEALSVKTIEKNENENASYPLIAFIKANLNTLLRLKPIRELYEESVNIYASSLLYKTILMNKEICNDYDFKFRNFKQSPLHEVFKGSSPAISAFITKMETDVARAAGVSEAQPAILTRFKRATNDDLEKKAKPDDCVSLNKKFKKE